MKIKLHVSTGWANGDHVDYQELPENWDEFTEDEKQKFIDECATDYLHECCEAAGWLVEDDEDYTHEQV